jgi:hypothetical protein
MANRSEAPSEQELTMKIFLENEPDHKAALAAHLDAIEQRQAEDGAPKKTAAKAPATEPTEKTAG